jgi:putative aminopeptidase FrvX
MENSSMKFLSSLVEAEAPVGHEAAAVSTWLKFVKPFADDCFTDAYGNGYAILNPEGDPAIVVTGHADEIGLMVTYIDDEGFVWVGSLGGYDAKILPAMRVKVLAKGGALHGVIGAMPPHLQHAETGGTPVDRYKFGDNIYIDIGAKDKKDAEKLVSVGDPVILDYGLRELKGGLVTSRGLDNKVGIWVAAQVLKRVQKRRAKLKAKLIALASVQEEIGGHGAAMAAFRLEPDLAIAIDVCQSMDHPFMEKKRFGDQQIGRGPVLGHGSANHPVLVDRLTRVARRKRIDLQHEALPNRTGTDADSIFTVKCGIPTATVSIPQRYMHSPVETLSISDMEQTADLVAELCLDLKSKERIKVVV